MPTNLMKYTVILDPEEDGGYSIHCPALSGCVSQGENRADALKNIEEAILGVLEVLEEQRVAMVSTSESKD